MSTFSNLYYPTHTTCLMIEFLTLDVICETKLGGFKVIQEWTCQFMKHYMNWTWFKASTTIDSKLLEDQQEKGKFMAYHVAYLAKTYYIPPSLVVNSDQIDIHLAPIVGKRTWESRGFKHIHLLDIKDKWQVNVVVSSSTVGVFLPLQIIFTCTTSRTLPLNNQRKIICVVDGWDFTFSENY
jgi:hypothetical protein